MLKLIKPVYGTLEKNKPQVNIFGSIKMGNTVILLEKSVDVKVTPKYHNNIILHYINAKYVVKKKHKLLTCFVSIFLKFGYKNKT